MNSSSSKVKRPGSPAGKTPGTHGQVDRAVRNFIHGRKAVLRSGCKLNLYLKITGLLPNGFHSLNTFFLPLPPAPIGRELTDILRLEPRPSDCSGGKLKVRCAESWFDPCDNTLQKAFSLYDARVGDGELPSLELELIKSVPCGAGLGGGSANAAALLLFLEGWRAASRLTVLGRDELLRLAATVGADVPCFVLDRPAWAEGIGDRLTPAPAPFAGRHLVLVCPALEVSTAWAYRAWDEYSGRKETPSPADQGSRPDDVLKILANLPPVGLTSSGARDSNNSSAVPPAAAGTASPEVKPGGQFKMYNSFERVVFTRFPVLAEIKQKLLAAGAADALMSGSGSGIFGLFHNAGDAADAAGLFKISGLRVYTRSIPAGASPSW